MASWTNQLLFIQTYWIQFVEIIKASISCVQTVYCGWQGCVFVHSEPA